MTTTVKRWECTNQQYHASLTADSHSSLDLFHKSIEQYAAQRIFRTYRPIPTEAMIFGTLFHTTVLEPEQLDKEYVLEEKHDRRTKKGKIGAQDFLERAAGRTIATAADMDKAQAMRDGVMRNPEARRLMEDDGECEATFLFSDRNTGSPLKCRMDRLLKDGLIVDLKSTDDVRPDAWAKTVHNFGYHRQAALYSQCAYELGIEQPFIFLACSKTPPHECVCYKLCVHSLQLGHSENRHIITDLSVRRACNDWSGRWAGKINEVTLPRYAFQQH